MLTGKGIIFLLTIGLIKYIIQTSKYFPEPKSSGGRVKVELDSPNCAMKGDLKNATGADTSKFAKKIALPNFKSDVDKLDIDKLKMYSLT